MQLDEARSLKASVIAATTDFMVVSAEALALGPEPFALRAGPFGMTSRSGESVVRPWEGVALGLTKREDKDVHLALRATSDVLLATGPIAQLLDERREEVDVEITGEINPYAAPYEGPIDPLQAGYSVGHFAITAGTLGAFAEQPNRRPLILSNNHVLAAVNAGSAGDAIVQPGPIDSTAPPQIGTLLAFEQLVPNTPNLVDAAIAELGTNVQFTLNTSEQLTPSGFLRTDDIDTGLAVTKVGRTTGVTRGAVSAVELDGVRVNYREAGVFTFDNQLEIKTPDGAPFSLPGDSGSLIVTDDADRYAVGLLFAGGSALGGLHHTFANPIQTVLDTLSIELLTI